ncbi:hypothetical protein G1K75_12180 [Tenacibaculum finnmarkense]|uniref:hypothetical protein n=1 Tax=Tenacibaculum finnmarkense TaxID=2781243 RepID=UPI001EFB76BA|nr:hypothetical protein [Tenacibaculum finnmarkense]MCG8806409.1 hypothetical protein [Tenacibaculum finnmarkense]MCG8857583.1 hypothetical protein [Tenacibaculum finnmarkense]MDB0616148.1 hypothetical protein [Tenacibaculum dicentrarchi]
MNQNINKHKILQSLFEKKDDRIDSINKDEFIKKLHLNPEICTFIFETLKDDNEVDFLNVRRADIYITEQGKKALFSEKYKKQNENVIIGFFKIFTQIAIPILSLTIAFIALTLKLTYFSKTIEEKVNLKNKTKIESINKKLDSILKLQNKKENNPMTQNDKNESNNLK